MGIIGSELVHAVNGVFTMVHERQPGEKSQGHLVLVLSKFVLRSSNPVQIKFTDLSILSTPPNWACKLNPEELNDVQQEQKT